MSAFNFDLSDENGMCYSKAYSCSYSDGYFDFYDRETSVGNTIGACIGNSSENNCGGIGGFVGRNHEYFLYCGSKHAEIAIARLNKDCKEWEDYGILQWFDDELDNDGYGFFEDIWFTHKDLALIFEPKKEFRSALMQHEDLTGKKNCIKLDLSTGTFTGLTRKQFNEQKHSVADENSKWPPTQQALISDIVDNTKVELCACLDEVLRKLTILSDVRLGQRRK